MQIHFKSPDHKTRFIDAVHRFGDIDHYSQLSSYYASALFILSCEDWLLQSSTRYINDDGINFPDIIENIHLSSGYTALVKLAHHLFNEVIPINLSDYGC